MNDLQYAIWEILFWNHRGKDNPLTLEALMIQLLEDKLIKKIDKNQERRVREAIAGLKKVCSAGEGYYHVREFGHPEDVEEACNYIHRTYVQPLLDKIARKKKAFPQYFPKKEDEPKNEQMRLPV